MDNDSALYFLLEIKNPTKYDLPLLIGSIDKRYEVLNDLKEKPPRIIIENTEGWFVDGISGKKRRPEIYSFIYKKYALDKKIGKYNVYKLRNADKFNDLSIK